MRLACSSRPWQAIVARSLPLHRSRRGGLFAGTCVCGHAPILTYSIVRCIMGIIGVKVILMVCVLRWLYEESLSVCNRLATSSPSTCACSGT